MSAETDPQPQLTAGAQRILDVAAELFYWRGIHAVGVDTIAAESGVTKRTLYNRFGSKDNLVAAYLATRDQRWRALITSRLTTASPDPIARALVPFDVLADWLSQASRGCSFVNAFAELPDPHHPGRPIIAAEKTWLRDLFHQLLSDTGIADPGTLAGQLLILHEGAIIAHSITGDPTAAASARAAAARLITEPRQPT